MGHVSAFLGSNSSLFHSPLCRQTGLLAAPDASCCILWYSVQSTQNNLPKDVHVTHPLNSNTYHLLAISKNSVAIHFSHTNHYNHFLFFHYVFSSSPCWTINPTIKGLNVCFLYLIFHIYNHFFELRTCADYACWIKCLRSVCSKNK